MKNPIHHFALRNYKDKNGEQNILWLVVINQHTYKLNTLLKTDENTWDKKKERIKSELYKAVYINSKLSEYRAEADKMIILLRSRDQQVSIEDFKLIIEGVKTDSFIDYCRLKLNLLKGVHQKGTTRRYTTEINKLEKFSPKIAAHEINDEYLMRLNSHMRDELQNKINTIHKMFKFLRTFLNYAKEDKYITDNPIPSFMRRYKIKPENGRREFLSKSELTALEQLLSGSHPNSSMIQNRKMLKNTLSWFLFACYTSLRYGDMRTLTHKHVLEYKGKYSHFTLYIDKIAAKNSATHPKRLIIPLIKKAVSLLPDEIIEDPEQLIWHVYPNQKVNDLLKIIATAAEIDKNLTFHASRHTFATLALNMGMPMEVVQELLGHSELKTTSIYAKMLSETTFKAMERWEEEED